MTTLFKFFILVPSVALATFSTAYASYMYIDAPEQASSNRAPFALTIYLDAGAQSISGLSGDLSFPSELFDVDIISAYNSVVPLWAVQPKVSVEKQFDRRTHIVFEGIIPGGFSGVNTAYGKGLYPGIIFTVTLIPKGSGVGDFTLNPVELHAYDETGTIIKTRTDSKKVTVPSLSGKEMSGTRTLIPVSNKTVTMTVTANELIDANNSYVYIHDEDSSRVIDHIEIAESREYSPVHVSSGLWRTVSNPHVLSYSSRTQYVHAKIMYTDGTYTFKTVPPVENSQSLSKLSRILVYILIAISLLYHYGKNFLHIFSKSPK